MTSLIDKALSCVGLMRVREHEAVKAAFLRDIKAEREKFKAASRDLAGLAFQIEDLTPDAQKWRDYLKRSRERKRASAAK